MAPNILHALKENGRMRHKSDFEPLISFSPLDAAHSACADGSKSFAFTEI